ncbi:ubiquitin carboxyl-terminal hydrolase 37-like isoform X5 [Lates japonicus]|uniref:Ubiquitin carboxyl-terminal hydrolase 37-like isoform X5 n=1 Tax=Lates japonicus TaxID=270547 RepID=A0AAD3RFW5_LATJO|nr:ubiquitin carboxyl-terminal hydrolase 37-like isoform X5 [Lates japonicus]
MINQSAGASQTCPWYLVLEQETELVYKCECGATSSGRRSSFATLPRVLVLHLRHLRFTPYSQLQKIHDPVVLFRELVMSSNQGGGCYSLVSTISHISISASVCDHQKRASYILFYKRQQGFRKGTDVPPEAQGWRGRSQSNNGS